MPQLPTTGVLSYGGHQFSSYTSTRINARHVYDRARRTIVGVNYNLDVTTQIVAEGAATSTNQQMSDIRRRLSTPGGRLEISRMGFGDLIINDPSGTVRDISYGPHPEILEAQPIGYERAWLVHWICGTTIPECTKASYLGQLMALNFTWDVKVSEHGVTTISIDGYAEIPATRIGGSRVLPDNADRYWEEILRRFPLSEGFRRAHSRRLSDDKRVLTFSITDTELAPGNFIPGITDWKAESSVSTSQAQGMIEGVHSLSAEYTVARSYPKVVAYEHFMALLNSRINAGRQFWKQRNFVPLQFQVRDQINSEDVSIQCSYLIIVNSFKHLVAATGMWTPVPKANWLQWRDSFGPDWHRRGNAGIVFDRDSDSILDLCVKGRSPRPAATNELKTKPERRALTTWPIKKPDKDHSWLKYKATLEFVSDTNILVAKPLVEEHVLKNVDYGFLQKSEFKVTDKKTLDQSSGGLLHDETERILRPVAAPPPPKSGSGTASKPAAATPPGKDTDIMQQRVLPSSVIVLRVEAVRAGYRVPTPALLKVGGVSPILLRTRSQQAVFSNAGVPIIKAYIESVYHLPELPKREVQFPHSPILSDE